VPNPESLRAGRLARRRICEELHQQSVTTSSPTVS